MVASAPNMARQVLDATDIKRAITRITHEILEKNRDSRDLVLIGIPTRGDELAARIAAKMSDVEGSDLQAGSLDVTMFRDDLRRQPTRAPGRTVVPVGGIDDLMSGRTIRAALDALNEHGRPRAVQLAVLVDRGHRELPIRADYVGKNLPTSKSERVQVRLSETDHAEDSVTIVGDAE